MTDQRCPSSTSTLILAVAGPWPKARAWRGHPGLGRQRAKSRRVAGIYPRIVPVVERRPPSPGAWQRAGVTDEGSAHMHIIDSQVHIWGADTPARPWPPGRAAEAQKQYPISKETLLFEMDRAGVRRMVLVPPSWEGDRNDLALEAARLYPDRFAVMGRLALQDPESRARVADWKKQPGMLGMRFTFHNGHNRHFLTDGSADWLARSQHKPGFPIWTHFLLLLHR